MKPIHKLEITDINKLRKCHIYEVNIVSDVQVRFADIELMREKLRNQLAKLFDDKDYYFECGYQKMSSDCQDCICGYLPNNRYYWIRAWKE